MVNMCTRSCLKTSRILSSQIIYRLSLGSCKSLALMCCQILLVVCGRDSCSFMSVIAVHHPSESLQLTCVSPPKRLDNAGDRFSGFFSRSVVRIKFSTPSVSTHMKTSISLRFLWLVSIFVQIRIIRPSHSFFLDLFLPLGRCGFVICTTTCRSCSSFLFRL